MLTPPRYHRRTIFCPLLLAACATLAAAQSDPFAPARFSADTPDTRLLTGTGALSGRAPSLPRTFPVTYSRDPAQPSIDSDQTGSTFVPMDSWVYPALERLNALGVIPSQSVGIRPWTRQECRRQLREAEDTLHDFASLDTQLDPGARKEAMRLLPELEYELREPNGTATAVLESAYLRAGTIAGPALTDGYHFGQTWWNDYGRPLGRGTSVIGGISARAVRGRYFLYAREEIQTDPGVPALTASRAALFNGLDNVTFGSEPPNPFPLTPARGAYVRERPIGLYAGVAFAGASLSFGKQELYWGPTTMGPLSFSMNAEPTYNLRLNYTRPHPFPFVPQLGTYRLDIVIGKLSGHAYPARPYFNGQKISLNFGKYLELGFTRWSLFFGVGHPMTLGNLGRNFVSTSSTGTNFSYGDRADPGDRKSDFDFRLHLPGPASSVTLYADGYSDDDLSPADAPRRAVWHPGVYLARLPGLPHADLRFEMASSQELARDEGGTRVFINNQYRDANTNKGFLLGNAVGRDARAFEGRTGYWFSPRTRVEAGYRQSKISQVFLPNGGTISDGFVNASVGFHPDWAIQTFVQYERFLIPSDVTGRQSNTSARLQITWTPHKNQ